MIEKIKKYIWPISVLTGILVAYAIGYPSVYFFKEYGYTVFVIVPFFLGFVPPIVYGSVKEISLRKSFNIGFATLGIFCLTTLLFAIEGLICIIMASPILLLCTIGGSYVGFYFVKNKEIGKKKLYSFLLLPIIFLLIDLSIDSKEYLEVKTDIVIDAPIEDVWTNIISFGHIDEPTELIFKTGISYPTHAEIQGTGVGAVRYCNFTTGSFIEPITTWNQPTLLQFDVQEQPTPMRELNPFWDVHPPHLDGYFQSQKGQFQLTALGENSTKVEGTTWYKIHIHPIHYWDIWSKYILHQIHYRVLKHIKKESEMH